MRKSFKMLCGAVMLVFMCFTGSTVETQAANPLLPLDEYIPDVEAKVFKNDEGEERLYLYGSHDEYNSGTWCSHQYRVWSAPLTDLNQWTDHGVSFSSKRGEGYIWDGKDADGVSWSDSQLYAPDVAKIGDTYYLVTCNAGGPALGMATSKNPEGPFSPAKKIVYDTGEETRSIDPTLLVEGEGKDMKIYLYWGQRTSFGGEGLVGVELMKDSEGLYTIAKKDTKKVLFNIDEFGFYEGPSIRKINGKYYMLYPSDKGKGVHMMSYAVANDPLGDYKYMGNILDNDGCDLEGGNNHGSFCEINGQWYLFYHRGFGNSNMRRKVCVEKIFFDESGRIHDGNGNLVSMTNHGFEGSLNPYKKIEAAYATHVRLDGYKAGCYLEEKGKDLHPLTHITNGNCVEYKDFDFGNEGKPLYFIANILPLSGGSMDIILDDPENEPIGTVSVNASAKGGYTEFYTPISNITGVHTVYFKFNSSHTKNICELASFRFANADEDNIWDDFSRELSIWRNTKNAIVKKGRLQLTNNTQMETLGGDKLRKYTVQMDVQLKKGPAGIVFRKQDSDNFYLLSITEEEVCLKKIVNGKEILVGKRTEKTKKNEFHTWKIECSGESITIYKDGVRKTTFRDYTFREGKVGFYQPKRTEAYFDNVNVSKFVSRFDRIEINGVLLKEFSNAVKEYTIKVKDGAHIPIVKAYSTDSDANVHVTQANEIPGTAIVKFDEEEYKIHFLYADTVKLKTDMFDGDNYGDFWEIQNPNAVNVKYEEGKGLSIKTEPTDLGTDNPPKNVFLQDASGDWTVETALTSNPAFGAIGGNWPSGGLVVYGEDGSFLKLVYLPGGVELNDSQGNKQQIPITANDAEQLLYLKLEKRGNEFFAHYSTDSDENYIPFATSRTMAAPTKIGLLTTGFNGDVLPEITFKYFKVTADDTTEEWEDVVLPTGIELDKANETIVVGGTGTIISTIMPQDATYKDVEWTVTDDSVAEIVNHPFSDVVYVKGKKAGTTLLQVIARDNPEVTAECVVTVRTPNLVEIVQANALTNIKNGTALEAMPFPKTVTLKTEAGEKEAVVTWNLQEVAGYNPLETKEQTFEVNGTVTLPEDIGNANEVALQTKILVTVMEMEDTDIDSGNGDINGGDNNGNQKPNQKPDIPKTADTSPIGSYVLLIGLSSVATVFFKKHK